MFARTLITASLIAVSAALLATFEASAAGALAVGTEPRRVWYGVNANSESIGEARARAMRACRQHGSCRVETVFWNKCFAFAWQGNGHSRYGWATRDTIDAAERAAVRTCEREAPSCTVVDSRCDTVGR
jgi:hypothetical protein